jgi:hypothetical protein
MQAVVLSLFLHEWALNAGAFEARLEKNRVLHHLNILDCQIDPFRGKVSMHDTFLYYKFAAFEPGC